MAGFPENFTVGLVKANEARSVSAANRQNYLLARNNAAAVVASTRGSAFAGFATNEFDAKIFFVAASPNGFTGGQIEATEFSVLRLNVDAFSVDEWSRARAG